MVEVWKFKFIYLQKRRLSTFLWDDLYDIYLHCRSRTDIFLTARCQQHNDLSRYIFFGWVVDTTLVDTKILTYGAKFEMISLNTETLVLNKYYWSSKYLIRRENICHGTRRYHADRLNHGWHLLEKWSEKVQPWIRGPMSSWCSKLWFTHDTRVAYMLQPVSYPKHQTFWNNIDGVQWNSAPWLLLPS